MKSLSVLSLCALALLVNSDARSEDHKSEHHHWQETATETLWRVRYSNCDYGFYVSLDDDIVGHGTHSPAPNHGIYVPLPDTSRTSPANYPLDRFVWVDAHYNASDYRSLRRVVKYELDEESEGKTGYSIVNLKPTTLGGLPAIGFTVKWNGPAGAIVESGTIALRSDIVYTVAVRSSDANITADRE